MPMFDLEDVGRANLKDAKPKTQNSFAVSGLEFSTPKIVRLKSCASQMQQSLSLAGHFGRR